MISFLSKIYFGLGSVNRLLATTNENGDVIIGEDQMPKISSEKTTKVGRILDVIRKMLNEIMLPFLITVAAAGTIYAIWLGVQYSKSEGDARGEAKKRIINFLIGFISIIVLLVLLELFVKYGEGLVDWVDTALGRGNNNPASNAKETATKSFISL